MVQHRLQRVEFEGLHVICFEWGEVGHRSTLCPRKLKGKEMDRMQEVVENDQEKATGSVNNL